jgi:hypothetical protein
MTSSAAKRTRVRSGCRHGLQLIQLPAARRAERSPLVESVPGKSQAPAGLDVLELTEYARHNCYGEITPRDEVVLNSLICSEGTRPRWSGRRDSPLRTGGTSNYGPSACKPEASSPDVRANQRLRRFRCVWSPGSRPCRVYCFQPSPASQQSGCSRPPMKTGATRRPY